MTDWRATFKAELFDAWRREGLPDPGEYEGQYDQIRSSTAPPVVRSSMSAGPLDPGTLHSVHGFGAAMGTVFACLLRTPMDTRATSVSWCARFNLGISLIDWLCDEGRMPASRVAELPAFASLARGRASTQPLEHPVVEYLDALASDLLSELERDVGAPQPNEPRGALWPTLRRLLRAELATVRPGFFDPTRPRQGLPTLRLKSVEPFRIMAERTLHTGSRVSPGQVALARRLGRAIGECVWLTDDADDLWRDLDARAGNRFIAEAAAADQAVVSADGTEVVDLALIRVLKREQLAQRLATQAVRRVAREAHAAPCGPGDRRLAMGLVAVSLARWSG